MKTPLPEWRPGLFSAENYHKFGRWRTYSNMTKYRTNSKYSQDMSLQTNTRPLLMRFPCPDSIFFHINVSPRDHNKTDLPYIMWKMYQVWKISLATSSLPSFLPSSLPLFLPSFQHRMISVNFFSELGRFHTLHLLLNQAGLTIWRKICHLSKRAAVTKTGFGKMPLRSSLQKEGTDTVESTPLTPYTPSPHWASTSHLSERHKQHLKFL